MANQIVWTPADDLDKITHLAVYPGTWKLCVDVQSMNQITPEDTVDLFESLQDNTQHKIFQAFTYRVSDRFSAPRITITEVVPNEALY